MSRVACPHCGFQNFAISAYCGRCERPMPRDAANATPPPRTPPPAASAQGSVPGSTATPPPAPRNAVASLVRAAEAADALRRPTTPAAASAPDHAASVPAPLPPIALEAAPLEKPIELGKNVKLRRTGPNLGDSLDDPNADVPVEVPGVPRLVMARLVDALVVLGAGALVAALEILIRGEHVRTRSYGLLDRAAEWLSFHSQPVLHGTLVAIFVGCVYGVYTTHTTGQTLGRRLTNTVLVRRSGKPMNPFIIALRTILALGSTLAFGAGFLWTVVDRYHRTWHDILSGTVVVRRHVRLPKDAARAARKSSPAA